MQVRIHNKETIDEICWPETDNGKLARQFLVPMIKEGTRRYFKNVETELRLLEIDKIFLPITINDNVAPNAYVCSTYTHYVSYALEEIGRVKNRWLQKLAKPVIRLFGAFLKTGRVDKTVFVNNWLLPTNLYPSLTQDQLSRITKALVNHFPKHTIAFRSVNDHAPGGLKNHLRSLNYDFLLCRDIYYTDTQSPEPFKARMTKSDLKLLNNTEYSIVENDKIPEFSLERIASLYQMLNIDKYSACNPQYTSELLNLMRSISGFNLKAWMKDHEVHAVLGYYTQDGIVTSPLFGYDTSLPQETGLYRQISAALLKDAKNNAHFLHQSSGAGHYKLLRKAVKDLEYTAVYIKHLPKARQLPWKALLVGMNKLGKNFL